MALAIRLARKFGISEEDAQALVEVGLDTPAKVKVAEDEAVEDAVGKDGLAKVRAAFPKR
jgi:hypothetical protein